MAGINGGSRISYIKVDFLFRGNENAAFEIHSMDQADDLPHFNLAAAWRRKGRFYARLASLIIAIYRFWLAKLAANAARLSSYDVYLVIRSRLERKSWAKRARDIENYNQPTFLRG
jgi:hypothetical protein